MKNLIAKIGIGIITLGGVNGVVADNKINPYIEKLDRLEISKSSTLEAGGENKVEMLKNEPKVILGKWNDEVRLGVKYKGIDPTTKGNRAFLTNRIEWKDNKGKEELHAYPLETKAGMEDGGYEIEIILNEKPLTNTFDFQIDGAEQLDFFYQPALTQKEIDEGASRPDNVIGSYAVYHKTKANHRMGDINYATGKAFHIYRPKAIDANGVEVWAELNITGGTLTVTVPVTFLSSAVYPVKVDPTFGWTSAPSTLTNFPGNNIYGYKATGFAGTLNSISFYGSNTSAVNMKGIMVEATGKTIISGGISSVTSINSATDQWWVLTYASPPTITAQSYEISSVPQAQVNTYYDETGGGAWFYDTTNNYTTPTNPTDGDDTALAGYTIGFYATYTATANPPLGNKVPDIIISE